MQQVTSSQEIVVLLTRSLIRETRDCLKKSSGVLNCCACVAKPIVCYDRKSNKYKVSSKVLNKGALENCGDGVSMSKCPKVLEEAANVTSTNRTFRTIKHNVAAYDKTKKGLSCFYPKRLVEEDVIHTKPLDL